jgi:TRAP-type mannitol/chloroaromatic compound transport system substrate-binding protein
MSSVDGGGVAKAVLPRDGVPARRKFVAAAAGSVIAGFPMISVAQSSSTLLRLQCAWSAKDIFYEYALDFAKKINDMSGGRLRIEMLPAGAVVKAQDLQDAVHRGVVDGCHAVPALWHPRNAAFSLFGCGPALGMDGNGLLAWLRYGGGMDLYLELVHRQLNLNVLPFFTGPMPAQPLGWYRKPVQSAADIRGLRVRAYGLAADLFREMGARPVTLPVDEVAVAWRRGEIDAAALNNPSTDDALGMPDIAKVCMLRSQHQTAEVFEVLLNRARFNALPADLQAIVRHAADAASADMSWKALQRYSADQAQMRDREGVQFRKTSQDFLRRQMLGWKAVVARHAPTNPFFDRVWQSQRTWARRTVGWLRDSVPDPAMAHEFWAADQSVK